MDREAGLRIFSQRTGRGGHYRHQDGDKTTLQKMRNLLLEKRNFTLEQDSRNNFVITFLDSGGNDLENQVASMLVKRMEQGKKQGTMVEQSRA